ncbi:PAS domain-containing protein [Mucilaginibacter sp. 22184]|uniref:PAS domain-containing protein n=1 Tax=Mucilaginibacter sp. 22184 TaxID=3453887 RepID=UPI003F83E866
MNTITYKKHAPDFEIVHQSIVMFAYWDRGLICRYASEAYAMWFGRRIDSMIDVLKLPELLKDNFPENLPYITAVLEGGEQRFEYSTRASFGEIRKGMVTYSPNFANGEIDGFFVHIKDIANNENKNALVSHKNLESFNSLPERIPIDVEATLKSCLFAEFPGIAKLSKQHFVSESKLKRDFRAKFNMSVFAYYRNLQMELAEKYLEENLYSKKQLAIIFNFSNPSNFTARYKKYLNDKTENYVTKKNISENKYELFVLQAPFAMAMFDKKMRYMAFSNKWLKDHNHLNGDLTGTVYNPVLLIGKLRSIEIYKATMRGSINKCDGELIEKPNGAKTWIKWEVRPWYDDKNVIGGLLIYTEDISVLKMRDIENDDVSEILGKANEIARIGSWKCDVKNNKTFLSKIAMEILDIPVGAEVDFGMILEWFKEGSDRNLIKQAYMHALTKGLTFSIEAEVTTWTGSPKGVRVIGYSEFKEGSCQKIAGIFQDISR